MIEYNKRLDFIDEYKPSNRIYDNNITKLDWNECNLPFSKKLNKIIKKSVSKISYSEYPKIDNQLLVSLISEYCKISNTKIQLFNGSDSALQYIFTSFLNINSKVLIFTPNYTQIEVYIKLFTNNISYSNILENFPNYDYNFDEIKNNDVIYISNPNNPTGIIIKENIIENLLKTYPNKLFIIDEAYYEFSKNTSVGLINKYKNIIVTRTFSKALSLASIRLGYICSDESLLSIINKIRNTKEVNSFAQSIATDLLKNYKQIQKRINKVNKIKNKFSKHLDELKIPYIPSESNFILIKVNNSETIIKKLLNNKILVRDRSMFLGLENCIRITIGQWTDMKIILKILKKYDKH
jgi:histidinol-phosphate aminotransferase